MEENRDKEIEYLMNIQRGIQGLGNASWKSKVMEDGRFKCTYKSRDGWKVSATHVKARIAWLWAARKAILNIIISNR